MTIPILVTPAYIIMPDGREICGTHGKYRCREGVAEYRSRIQAMLERQKDICCLYGFCPFCSGMLAHDEATFEHERGRGAGKRDDRLEVDGRWRNGAAHLQCNSWKGSRRISYNSPLCIPRVSACIAERNCK